MAKITITIEDTEITNEDGTLAKAININTDFDPPDMPDRNFKEEPIPASMHALHLFMETLNYMKNGRQTLRRSLAISLALLKIAAEIIRAKPTHKFSTLKNFL